MKTAWIGIREQPHYRRDAFAAGLRACGYDVRFGVPTSIGAGDVLVSWNRYGMWHDIATRAEAAGAVVLVAENGYVGPDGVSPHDMEPRCWYALAVGGHNGRGAWPYAGPERWNALNVKLWPWAGEGGHVLVCPNRSFGQPGNVMPPDWANDVARRLRAVTDREIRIRPHPGNGKAPPLEPDLHEAHACVIWSSSVGLQALIAGVTVICEAPHWICKTAALPFIKWIEKNEFCGADEDFLELYRRAALERLAHAQWHVDEIASGEPFARLIEHATKREAVAA